MSDFDIVYVGDFCQSSDAVLRTVEEVRLNALIGYRTGLMHLRLRPGGVDPAIIELLERGEAVGLGYDEPVNARLALIVDPAHAFRQRPELPVRLHADRILAVLGALLSVDRLTVLHQRLVQHLGPNVEWTATAYDALRQLRSAGLKTMGTVWQSYGRIQPTPDRRHWSPGSRPLIGTAVGEGADHWPTDPSEFPRIWDTQGYRVRVAGTPPAQPTRQWQVLGPAQRQQLRLVSELSAFLYYPDERPLDMPLTAIGTCLAANVPVLLAPHLKPAIGVGPHYVGAGEVARTLPQILSGATASAPTTFDPLEMHRRRLRFWLGRPPHVARRVGRRVMFFPSNGDGLGHVTRTLAVARRLPSDITPIFATLSSGISVIRDAGFHAEMIVSHRYANLDTAVAYPWMDDELSEILARHQPDIVVFDGGNPYNFMTDVIARRRGPAYVWLRRGMWQSSQDNAPVLAKEKYFDAIIEPRDLAASEDRGATADRNDGVVYTDPIRLIDESEQLSRAEARRRLKLDPDRPAAIVQLGAGNQRDVAQSFNMVLAHLAALQVQVVNVASPISRNPLRHPGTAQDIAIYPVARYLKAFDFAISAAGYNSFHELVCSAIPTLFIVGMRPELDDQMGRARYAEAHGAAFALADSDLSQLKGMITTLADPAIQAAMSKRAQPLFVANGAVGAAEFIAECAL